MKYLVTWDKRFKKPKHFGTVIIADNYLILFDSERNHKDGVSFYTPFELVDKKLKTVDEGKSIVRLPNTKIEYEILTEEEFDNKYTEGLEMEYKM